MQATKERFIRDAGSWYIRTEDGQIGPFADKSEAQLALLFYSERSRNPSDKQLRRFIGTDSQQLRRSAI